MVAGNQVERQPYPGASAPRETGWFERRRCPYCGLDSLRASRPSLHRCCVEFSCTSCGSKLSLYLRTPPSTVLLEGPLDRRDS